VKPYPRIDISLETVPRIRGSQNSTGVFSLPKARVPTKKAVLFLALCEQHSIAERETIKFWKKERNNELTILLNFK
jgi:hypothetical protein